MIKLKRQQKLQPYIFLTYNVYIHPSKFEFIIFMTDSISHYSSEWIRCTYIFTIYNKLNIYKI